MVAGVDKLTQSTVVYDASQNNGTGAFVVQVRGSISGAFTGTAANDLGLQVGTIVSDNDNEGLDRGAFASTRRVVGNRVPLADAYYRSLLRMRGVYPVSKMTIVAAGLSSADSFGSQVTWHRSGRTLTARFPVPATNPVFANLGDYWWPLGVDVTLIPASPT